MKLIVPYVKNELIKHNIYYRYRHQATNLRKGIAQAIGEGAIIRNVEKIC